MPTVTIHTPEKLIVSENGTAQAEPKPAASQLDKFVIANASFAIWLIFLAIGGGITALYYSRIPDIDVRYLSLVGQHGHIMEFHLLDPIVYGWSMHIQSRGRIASPSLPTTGNTCGACSSRRVVSCR